MVNLSRALLERLYARPDPIPWHGIFGIHRIMIVLSGYFLISSKYGHYGILRTLASSCVNTIWLPPSLDFLESKTAVCMAFSPWHHYTYIGKTMNMWERVRKHILGFLRLLIFSADPTVHDLPNVHQWWVPPESAGRHDLHTNCAM